MTRTLITFLGRVAGRGRGYNTATYEFEELSPQDAASGESTLYTTSYFGLALIKHLGNLGRAPDRVVVFGTSSSMWDEFLAKMLDDSLTAEERDALRQRAEDGQITAEFLDRWHPQLRSAMKEQYGTEEIDLRILSSHLVSADEQIGVVHEMTEAVSDEDRIVLDVTHGFRHLPLLSCFAALTMRRIRRAAVEGIYYGAWEMRDAEDITPVARLDGLLQIVDWLSAFDISEATGDLSAFEAALRRVDAPEEITEKVREAGFLRNSGQFEKAAMAFDDANAALEVTETASPLLEVFAGDLKARIKQLQGTQYKRLRAVALEALDVGRLDRAADFGLDAAMERIRSVYHNVAQVTKSEEVSDALLRSRTAAPSAKDAFRRLRGIRNWLAHSGNVNKPRKDVIAAMRDHKSCRDALCHDLELLLPANKQQRF